MGRRCPGRSAQQKPPLFWDTDPSNSVTEKLLWSRCKAAVLASTANPARGQGTAARPGAVSGSTGGTGAAQSLPAWRQLLPGASSEPGSMEPGKLPCPGAGWGQLMASPWNQPHVPLSPRGTMAPLSHTAPRGPPTWRSPARAQAHACSRTRSCIPEASLL